MPPRRLRPQFRLVWILTFPLCAFPAAAQDVDAAWKELFVQGQYATNEHDWLKAEQTLQRALREAERFGPDDTRVATTLTALGATSQAAKRFSEAESYYRRSIAIMDKGDVAENVDFADLNFNLAIVLTEQGKQSAAIPLLEKSRSIYATQFGGHSLKMAAAQCAIGDALRGMKLWTDAEDPLKRCAEIRESDGGVLNPALGDALFSLALVYEKEGKYNLADPRFKLAERIREKTLGIMSPGFADVLEAHAALLKMMGRDKEALQDATLAAAIRRHPR